jgi:Flp pilus assembly protein TadG
MRSHIGDGLTTALRRLRGERGDTLIEFALASMLFFTLIFGILEFGQAVWRYNMVSDLAQEGARRAVVCGAHTGLSSTDCDIQSFVSSRSVGLTVTVTTTPLPLSSLIAGDPVQVRVRNSFTPLTTLIPHSTMTLESTANMVMQR